jgi:hypothetical protein
LNRVEYLSRRIDEVLGSLKLTPSSIDLKKLHLATKFGSGKRLPFITKIHKREISTSGELELSIYGGIMELSDDPKFYALACTIEKNKPFRVVPKSILKKLGSPVLNALIFAKAEYDNKGYPPNELVAIVCSSNFTERGEIRIARKVFTSIAKQNSAILVEKLEQPHFQVYIFAAA